MKVNFGLTADDYAKFRAGFPGVFFDRVYADGFVNEAVLHIPHRVFAVIAQKSSSSQIFKDQRIKTILKYIDGC